MTITFRDVDPPPTTKLSRSRPSSLYLDNRQIEALNIRIQDAVDEGSAPDFLAAMGDALRDPRYLSFRKSAGCPLHWIAAVGSPSLLADYLRLQGFKDVRVRNSAGLTPLHVVAAVGFPESSAMASLLLAAGADVNARDKQGMTPLHFAVGFPAVSLTLDGPQRSGRGDVMALVSNLMAEGANPDLANNAGEKPSNRWVFAESPSLEKPHSMPTLSDSEESYADPIPVSTVASSDSLGTPSGEVPSGSRRRRVP